MALPISRNVGDWPDLLCGPILRRVTPTSVAVFVAFKSRCRVTLEIYNSASPGAYDTPLGPTVSYDSVALGEHLHVCVAEWHGTTSLKQNQIYGYDLLIREIPDNGTSRRLGDLTPHLLDEPYKLGYDERLPSFVLPPHLKELVVVHGSCRKPHAPGADALAILNTIIASDFTNPIRRPHHLLLTGDQIYADDVAIVLATTLKATAKDLLGWRNEERIPRKAGGTQISPSDPPTIPGPARGVFVNTETTFTSGTSDKRLVDGHLMFLGEFYAMYLFAWSDDLWPRDTLSTALPIRLPTGEELRPEINAGLELVNPGYLTKIDGQRTEVHTFAATLPKVRRALANVPTMMMFDDHEVTDDWYLNRKWAADIRANPPGRQIIRNALAAYAVFQDWGNQPENYRTGTLGRELLSSITWHDAPRLPPIESQPGMLDVLLDLKMTRASLGQRIRWDWQYSQPGSDYQIVALDTRTWRSFPTRARDAAALIETDSSKNDEQLVNENLPMGFEVVKRRPTDNRLTIVLSPAPVLGHPIAELAQKAGVLGARYSVPLLEASLIVKKNELDRLSSLLFPTNHDQRVITQLTKEIAEMPARIQAAKRTADDAPAEYDNEAWSSNRIAFEDLLRRLAGFKRTLIVSGDVHYAFSAEMAYFRTGSNPAHPARIIQFCSSALKNEGDLNRKLADVGYEFVPRTMGWLGFDRDLAGFKADFKGAIDTHLLSTTSVHPNVTTGLARLVFQFEINERFSKPAVIPSGHYTVAQAYAKARALAGEANTANDHTDWRYAITYLQDGRSQSERTADWAAVIAAMSGRGLAHRNRLLVGGARSVVGTNNIGHIRFAADVAMEINRVTHRILWQEPITRRGSAGQSTQDLVVFFTDHTANLELPTPDDIPEVTP